MIDYPTPTHIPSPSERTVQNGLPNVATSVRDNILSSVRIIDRSSGDVTADLSCRDVPFVNYEGITSTYSSEMMRIVDGLLAAERESQLSFNVTDAALSRILAEYCSPDYVGVAVDEKCSNERYVAKCSLEELFSMR